jgi:hypothetical protein
MARFVYEGKTNVYWVLTIATTSTPSTTEISGGVDLTNFIAKDGVAVNINGNNVDSATIAETFNSQTVGSWGADLQLTMFRDDSADTAWNTCVYGSTGFLVIDRFNVSGSDPTNTDKVEVWPAQMHQPSPENSAQDTQVRFVEMFAVTSQPYLSATVTT